MRKENIVLAVDLDGTLIIDDDNGIHPNDIEVLKTELPVTLILATGRSLLGTRYPFQKNGLLDGSTLNFPLVLNNGGLLCAPGEEPRAFYPFSQDVADDLIKIATDHSEATFLLQGITEVYQIGNTEDGVRALRGYGFFPTIFQPQHRATAISKLMVLSDFREVLENMATAFAHLPIEGNFSLHNIYEASPAGVNKGKGLKELLEILGLEDATLVVAGDGDNDACMFSIADRSFAPTNARDFIREMADEVIDPSPRGLLTPILEKIL